MILGKKEIFFNFLTLVCMVSICYPLTLSMQILLLIFLPIFFHNVLLFKFWFVLCKRLWHFKNASTQSATHIATVNLFRKYLYINYKSKCDCACFDVIFLFVFFIFIFIALEIICPIFFIVSLKMNIEWYFWLFGAILDSNA